MNAPRKLAAYAVALLLVLAAGFGLGKVIDPGGPAAPVDHVEMDMDMDMEMP